MRHSVRVGYIATTPWLVGRVLTTTPDLGLSRGYREDTTIEMRP